jgi:hypothetical protein
MRVTITGDSFVKDYKDTYLERIVLGCDMKLTGHRGYPGQSQYKIWENFNHMLQAKPDVIIIVHTEYSRLYHPTVPINPNITNYSFDKSVDPEIISAAHMYYQHLYNDEHSFAMYKLMINDIQNRCKQLAVKLINIPAFNSTNVDKFYGLWLVSDMGLTGCSKADWPEWDSNMIDTRINHFSPSGHEILASNSIPHIRNYLYGSSDLEIHMIHPQYFG